MKVWIKKTADALSRSLNSELEERVAAGLEGLSEQLRQREGVLRGEFERRVQLAISESIARGGQQDIIRRNEIERRIQLAIAEVIARAEEQDIARRNEVEYRVQLAIAEAVAAAGGGQDRSQSEATEVESPSAVVAQPEPVAQPQSVGQVVVHRQATRATDAAGGSKSFNPGSNPTTLWVDLTTAFEWTGGVVGIVRAELEIACGLKRIDPTVRFSMQIGNGFAEIEQEQLEWLLGASNIVDAYMKFFGRDKNQETPASKIHVTIPESSEFFHPYGAGDLVMAAGWMDSRKEEFFSKLKAARPDVYVCYLVYDVILLLNETSHFYERHDRERFYRYVEWISHNCDFILFGGETSKRDTALLQQKEGWPTPPGQAIQFGTDIMKSVDPSAEPDLLAGVGITGPFIITVGSLEPRKNHETLYRAYLLAIEMAGDRVPQLIVCGRPVSRVWDLMDTLRRDPRLKGRLIHLSPTEAELAALYKNCLFTLLPSLYEGWSLTLPESLGQAKFCLAADTPPLREIGGDLVDYVAPFDVQSWAEKIALYATDATLLKSREEHIRRTWPPTRWSDTAEMAYRALRQFSATHRPMPSRPQIKAQDDAPTIWMDLTLTFLQWNGHVTGIIRSELTFAYYLKQVAPNTRYFAYVDQVDGYFFEIEAGYLSWLFEGEDLTIAYKRFHDFWRPREAEQGEFRNPFHVHGKPLVAHPAYLPYFPQNSVVFFAGIDMDGTGEVHRCRYALELISAERSVMASQLIYDLTPTLFPHLHAEWTCIGYGPFVKFVSDHFDHLVYGGRTAQRDGIKLQQESGWKSPPSDFIEFGSDLALAAIENAPNMPQADVISVLSSLGITSQFVMMVATIEPRKNHDMIYKAFLHIMDRDKLVNPLQIVFIGKKGWKTDDFLATFEADQRIKSKILMISPSDDELVVLYKNCLFTLLPSLYEGWSLTLPESLSYGKFCLVSDVDPLRETGRDLVEYIHPFDTFRWAERIEHYANHPEEVAQWEARIRSEWHPKTWRESTEMLVALLHRAHRARFPSKADNPIHSQAGV